MRRRSALAVLAATALLSLAACSDDEEGSSETTAAAAADTDAPAATDAATTETTEGTDDTMATPATSGGSDTTAGGEASGDNVEFCDAAQPLAEFNANQPALDVSASFEETRDQTVEVIESGLPLYEDAIEVAPDEVRGQIELLRDLNVELIPLVEAAADEAEAQAAIGELATSEVITATVELDTYLQTECGFGLTE